MKRIALITVTCIFLAINTVSASLELHASSDSIWFGDSLDFTCSVEDVTGTIYTEIISPLYTHLPMGTGDGNHSYRYTPQILGTFEAYCTNGSVDSVHKTFTVSSLVIEITGIESVYSDEEVYLRSRIFKQTETLEEIISGLDLNIYLDDSYLDIEEPYYYMNEWHIFSKNSELDGRNYLLRLESVYEGKSNHTEAVINVKPALEFSITSINPVNVFGGEEITAVLSAKYHGSDILNLAGISAIFNDQIISFTRTANGIKIQAPEIALGTYNFIISLSYNDLQESETRQIYYVIPVHGQATDSDSIGVNGQLKFSKDGFTKTLIINNGLYSDSVPYGTYEIEAIFSKFLVRFFNVAVTQELTNILRYDSFPDLVLGGLRTAGGYAIEFTPSYSRAYIEAEYDASKVGDETKLKVYKCGNWNFDAKTCNGNWIKIQSDIDTNQNKAKFEVDSLSAFVIGEMKALEISASLDRKDYYTGQTMKLTGVVKDKDNKVVPDASVTYTVDGISDTLTTNSNGIFSADITVPRTEGRNVIIINATKVFYENAGAILEFNILRRKEFNVILPQSTEILEGEENELELILVNSGDTTLNNIRLSLNGLPSFSDYHPQTIANMMTGAEVKITITSTPQSSDKRVYTVPITIESNELTYTDSFVITVKRNTTEVNDTTNQTVTPVIPDDEFELDFSAITAYLSGNTTAIMNIGSIIALVVIIAFLGIRVNRKRKFTKMTRYYIMHILNLLKSEVIRGSESGILPKEEFTEQVRKPAKKMQRKRKPVKRKENDYLELKPHETGVG